MLGSHDVQVGEWIKVTWHSCGKSLSVCTQNAVIVRFVGGQPGRMGLVERAVGEWLLLTHAELRVCHPDAVEKQTELLDTIGK
jgi:hypothetical protein